MKKNKKVIWKIGDCFKYIVIHCYGEETMARRIIYDSYDNCYFTINQHGCVVDLYGHYKSIKDLMNTFSKVEIKRISYKEYIKVKNYEMSSIRAK